MGHSRAVEMIEAIGFKEALRDHLTHNVHPPPGDLEELLPVAQTAIEIFSEVCLQVRTKLDAHQSFNGSRDMTPSEICCGLHLDAFVHHRCNEVIDAN